MAPPRKSTGKGLTVTLTVSPDKLRDLVGPERSKEPSPVKETNETQDDNESKAAPESKDGRESEDSPAPSVSIPAPQPNGEHASDSNPATPVANGTPAPSTMGPPTEGVKKKGTKRSAAATNGTEPKVRGKPGPKKKPRLEDGTIDHSGTTKAHGAGAANKLGPKANQGAINAGLRALDRSGKPCRKWNKGGFHLKSFTGVVWEVHRWNAPPKTVPEESNGDSAAASGASATSSNKENKEETQIKSDAPSNHDNSTADVDMTVPSVSASSPAPAAVSTAS